MQKKKQTKETHKGNNNKKPRHVSMLTNEWIRDLENILEGQGRNVSSDSPNLVTVMLK